MPALDTRSYRCACGATYTSFVEKDGSFLGRFTLNSKTCPDGPDGCPACGSLDRKALIGEPGENRVPEGSGYPYHDRGLDREITSAQHRRQVCRELGVEPVEGGLGDVVASAKSKADAQRDARLAREREHEDILEHHPQMARYRELRDRGWLRDEEARIRKEMGL